MKVYDLFNSMAGWTDCRVTGALPAAFLNRCAQQGIELLSAEPEGEFSLDVRLRARDVKRAAALAQKVQCTLEPLSAGGAPRFGRLLLRRALAAAGVLLGLGLLVWSRLYIWDIEVSGNETVPTGRILDGLRECGVDCGTFWPGITSDNLRSELLMEVPELSWATVNVYGSRAEVIVRERVPKPEIWRNGTPTDVAAKKTGFVTEVRALNGTALVKPGSAVSAGEILISSSADSPFSGARTVHATGTVTAETYYELTAVTPLLEREKTYTGKKSTRWALVIGKNRYNFYGKSSISRESCDTITTVWDCDLGGIFTLPVSIVRETDREYILTDRGLDQSRAQRAMEAELRERLLLELGEGGEIGSEAYTAGLSDGKVVVCLRAKCTEDIGIEVPRE